MVAMTFKPFNKTLFKGRPTEYQKRAMWACIAPYLISRDKPGKEQQPKIDSRGHIRQQSKPSRVRWRIRSVYLGRFLLFTDNANEGTLRKGKGSNSSRDIRASILRSQPLLEWISDLIDAPSKNNLRIRWRKSSKDLLTVFKVVSVYLRMQASDDERVRWSLDRAKRICREPSTEGDWWKYKRYIDDALTRHRASAHIIFGMIQAILEKEAQGGPLSVAKTKHVKELRLRGWRYVTTGIQYAAYAQDRLTTAVPKHASGSWLKPDELWCLPSFAKRKQIPKIRLDKLTKAEISCLQKPRAAKNSKRTASTNTHNSTSAEIVD